MVAGAGHATVAEMLLAAGADKEAKRDDTLASPLHFASSSGHAAVVEKLLAAGRHTAT